MSTYYQARLDNLLYTRSWVFGTQPVMGHVISLSKKCTHIKLAYTAIKIFINGKLFLAHDVMFDQELQECKHKLRRQKFPANRGA